MFGAWGCRVMGGQAWVAAEGWWQAGDGGGVEAGEERVLVERLGETACRDCNVRGSHYFLRRGGVVERERVFGVGERAVEVRDESMRCR